MNPKIIFVLRPEYGVTNNDNPINGELAEYLMLKDAQTEEFTSGTIYYMGDGQWECKNYLR